MAQNKKRRKTHQTTKNTKPNVYKFRGNQQLMSMVSEAVEAMDSTDFAVLQTKVLTSSDENIYDAICDMTTEGMLAEPLDFIRIQLSKDYPEFKTPITEAEMFVVGMYLNVARMGNKDMAQIKDWAQCFKENPTNCQLRMLHMIRTIRKDKDFTKTLKGLDKIVDWNS